MSITNELMALDPTLVRHNEGHWQEDYIDVAGPGTVGYSSFNDAGLECETGEFMYGLVRILKPENVLETGTHVGVGASYMGMGLRDNFSGHLDTIEFLPELHAAARQRFEKMGLLYSYVFPHLTDARAFDPGDKRYGLILLDTEPQTRFYELVRYYDYLLGGGYVFIHDLHRHMGQAGVNPDHPNEPHWPWGELPDFIINLVKNDQLRPMHFPTPRGLTGFYKPMSGDYDWREGKVNG